MMSSPRIRALVGCLGTVAWCIGIPCESHDDRVRVSDVRLQLVGVDSLKVNVSRTVNGVPESDVLISGLRKAIEVTLQNGGLRTSEPGPFDPTLRVQVVVILSEHSLGYAITMQLVDRCMILRTNDISPLCVTLEMPTRTGMLPANGFYDVEELVLQLTAEFLNAWRTSNAARK